MTYDEYKKELDRTGLMRFWKKPPTVEAVNKDGEIVKCGTKINESTEKSLEP